MLGREIRNYVNLKKREERRESKLANCSSLSNTNIENA